jgi:hypothetical protein
VLSIMATYSQHVDAICDRGEPKGPPTSLGDKEAEPQVDFQRLRLDLAGIDATDHVWRSAAAMAHDAY